MSDESVNVIDRLCCNKSEVSWQKLPPFKICWTIWGFLSWSQMTKNAEKLRVASLSGWHHSGAVWGESPSMLFNLVMTRFEDDYNPHIIYDALCLAKEYGYNRELKRFMSISITTDCFHEANHKTCSTSFRTSEYVKLMNVNSEVCEQTNSALRKITSSTTFMSPSMYLRSLTLFLADINISNHKKK